MLSLSRRPTQGESSAGFEPRPESPGDRLYAGHLLTIWGIALSSLCLGLCVLWSARHRLRFAGAWSQVGPILTPLAFYVVFLLTSILTSTDPGKSSRELSEVFTLCALPLAWTLIRGEKSVRRLFDLLILMMVLLALYGLGQYLFTDYGPLDQRIPGPFSHYQTYSGILLVGDLLLIGRMVAGGGWRRPLDWAALALLNLTLLLTLTRGPWVAVFVVLPLALVMRSRRIFAAYLLALVLGGGVFVAAAPAGWIERMSSIVDLTDASNYDRLCMAWAGFHMISERPLFGVGPEMVEERYPIYRHPTAPRFHVAHLHNTFLHMAAERGLLSLAAYLWLTGVALLYAWRGFRRAADGEKTADLYLGVVLVLVGFNLAGLFEANWRDTEVQRLVLFVLAVPWCLRGDPGKGVSSAHGRPAA